MYKKYSSRLKDGCRQLKDIFSGSVSLILSGSYLSNIPPNRLHNCPDDEGNETSGQNDSNREPCTVLNEIVQNDGYKNWMKVVVALRMLNEFSIPIIKKVMVAVHQALVDKYGHDDDDDIEDTNLRSRMIEEIRMMHRQTVYPQQVKRCCDVSKWLTAEGPWEIAKVFFGHTQRNFVLSGPEALDASKVLNLMVNCRIMEEYIEDYESCRLVLKVRNKVMHSSKFELTNEERDESFDVVFGFLNDLVIPSDVVTEQEISDIRSSIWEIKESSLNIHALKPAEESRETPSPSGTNPLGMSNYCLNVMQDNNTIQITTRGGRELAKLYLVRNQNSAAARRSCSEISFSSLEHAQNRSSSRLPEMKVLLGETNFEIPLNDSKNAQSWTSKESSSSSSRASVFDRSRKRKIRRPDYGTSKRRKF